MKKGRKNKNSYGKRQDINIWTPYDRQRASACHSKESERKVKVPNSERGKVSPKRKEAVAKGGKGINTWTLSVVVFVFSLSACSIASIEYRNTWYSAVSIRSHIEDGQYKQYEEGWNTLYIKVSIVRQPSKYFVYQSINSAPTIKILSISKYQYFVEHRNTKYRLVHLAFNSQKSCSNSYRNMILFDIIPIRNAFQQKTYCPMINTWWCCCLHIGFDHQILFVLSEAIRILLVLTQQALVCSFCCV